MSAIEKMLVALFVDPATGALPTEREARRAGLVAAMVCVGICCGVALALGLGGGR